MIQLLILPNQVEVEMVEMASVHRVRKEEE